MTLVITNHAHQLNSGCRIKDRLMDFDKWQMQECTMLNISVDEHNKMIELAKRLQLINPAVDCYNVLWNLAFNWRTELTLEAIQAMGLVVD